MTGSRAGQQVDDLCRACKAVRRHTVMATDAEGEIIDWLGQGRIDLFDFNDHMDSIVASLAKPLKRGRMVERTGLVEGLGSFDEETGGRPAELFRFRREVLRERPASGVGLPGRRG